MAIETSVESEGCPDGFDHTQRAAVAPVGGLRAPCVVGKGVLPCLGRALACRGGDRNQVAELLRVSRQTVHNWVHRFQEREGLDLRSRLADAPRQGRPPSALGIIDPLIAEVIDKDPRKFGYHFTVRTAPLLREYLEQVHGIAVSQRSVSLAIERLRMRWKRPRHQLSLRPEHWRQSKGG
jgi:transposase